MNEFGYESGQNFKVESPWKRIRPDGLAREIFTQSFTALKTLGNFVNQIEGILHRCVDDVTGTSAMEAMQTYFKPLCCIFGFGKHRTTLMLSEVDRIRLFFSFLRQTTDMCVKVCGGHLYQSVSTAQAQQDPWTDTEGANDDEGDREKATRTQEAVNDILVWRALLMYILFPLRWTILLCWIRNFGIIQFLYCDLRHTRACHRKSRVYIGYK